MAVSRFEVRKQLVLEEANAIGTSYLRTKLIQEPDRNYIAHRLRDYVDLRLQYSGNDVSTLRNANVLKNAREETQRLQTIFGFEQYRSLKRIQVPLQLGCYCNR